MDRSEQARLLRAGIRGTATLAAQVHPTVMTGSGPLMGIEMEIRLPGLPPWKRIFREHPDLASRPLLDPDAVFEVLADPHDPRRVIIEWKPGCWGRPSRIRASSGSTAPDGGRPSGLRPAVLACR